MSLSARLLTIHGRRIGDGQSCFVIAEAGVNHNGDMALAHRLIDAAKDTGADAVKFQAFRTEALVTPDAPKADYQVQTTGSGGGQWAMLKALELSGEDHGQLVEHCRRVGITYLCTPYDMDSAEMLDRLDIPAFKIASTDTTNTPFLRQLARLGRPVILSTGMSTLSEIEEAMAALDGVADKVALLHCTSEYPAPVSEANLRAMETLRHAFGVPVGYSDHSEGVHLACWARTLGAAILEKHFTLDRALPGPDHRASVEPAALAELVAMVRLVDQAMGDGIKRPSPSERGNKAKVQKSLVATRDLAPGEVIAAADLACKRPGGGLPPKWFDLAVGATVLRPVAAHARIGLGDLEWIDG